MDLLRELRIAVRVFLRKPGFSAVAVLTTALAIGACTAIYSVVYGVLLQPLPYAHPDRLVQVWQVGATGGRGQFSDPNFEDVRDQSRAFGAFAEYADGITTIVAGAAPVRARQAVVSAQFFDVFETTPARGRTFEPSDEHEGAAPVAVVSDAFWHRVLGGSADLSSVPLRIADRVYTVIGVMPRRFDYPVSAEVWTPREQQARNPYRTGHNWLAVGRVSPSFSLVAARTDASTLARRLKSALGDETAMNDIALVPLKDALTGSVAQSLLVLLLAVACLLAIASANLANLLLVHVTSRRRELAVRAALGAGRRALARPLIAEVSLLVAAGAALGVGLGSIGLRVLAAIGPASLPRAGEIALSRPVLLMTLATTVVVAIGLSVTAAWRAGRRDVIDDLRQGQRGQSGSRAASRLRSGLVVAELAASFVLLIGAGLLGRSLALLLDQNPGFRTEGVLAIDLSSDTGDDPNGPRALAALHERIIDRLGVLPGVVSAGGINRMPMSSGYANGTFIIGAPGERLDNLDAIGKLFNVPSRTGQAEFRVASAGYFGVMGIPLLEGRVFDQRDAADAPHVAVVSQSLGKTRWPGEDVLGKQIQFGGMDGDLREFTIVGVVGDIHERGLDAAPRPTFYADYRQRPRQTSSFSITLRFAGASDAIVTAARAAIHDVDPTDAPRFRTIDEVVAASVSDRRFTALVTGAFAASALLLAIVGIYGVLAYVVSERTHEFGIRLALGASRPHVWRIVLQQAGVLVIGGVVIGIGASWLATSLLRTLLFGITPSDPTTFVAVTSTLATAAIAACAWPAFRATRVDPMRVLRGD